MGISFFRRGCLGDVFWDVFFAIYSEIPHICAPHPIVFSSHFRWFLDCLRKNDIFMQIHPNNSCSKNEEKWLDIFGANPGRILLKTRHIFAPSEKTTSVYNYNCISVEKIRIIRKTFFSWICKIWWYGLIWIKTHSLEVF